MTFLWIAGAVVLASATWMLGRRAGAYAAARRAAGEIETARNEVGRRLNELFALQELSYILAESLQPDRIADQITRFAARFLEAEGAMVALATDGARTIRVASAAGTLAPLAHTEVPEADAGLIGEAMGREQLELAERMDGEAPLLFADHRVDRTAIVPLRAHGVTVGAIALAGRADRAFTTGELRLLSTVATHAAIVLSNARLFEMVRAGRDQWETTFNALRDGLAVLDADNRIIRANRALGAMIQRSVPAVTGSVLGDALFGQAPELDDLLAAARAGAAPGPLVRRSDPLARTLRIGAAPLRDLETHGHLVVLIEDVTTEHEVEQQMIQQEKLAAVGQLVSGVAHELNNPLTSIAGLAEFLLEQPAPSERDRDHLKVIRDQADRAGRIVRNLLTFARKGPADIGPVDLNDVVQRTLSLMSYELRLREIQVETHLDTHLPGLRGDRYQLQQVVLNLITNAAQAVAANAPERPRRVTVTTTRENGKAALRVTDTGMGIPDEHLASIFTPFFTTKATGHGTGLGLSISYRIVEGHGGTLAVEHSAGGGATFVAHLPAEDTTPPAATEGRRPPTPVPAPVRRAVLVVDDDPAVCRMIGVLLATDTERVEIARDGEHAAALLNGRRWDLIIADARVPVSAGERFGEFVLRAHPGMRDRVLLLTADVREETAAWLRGTGCRFLLKPFRVAELKATAAAVFAATDAKGG